MPLLALGGLWLILWQGRARALGLLPMAAAMALWGAVERPDLLVAGSGGLVGVMTPEGRVLSKARGDGFAADSWLENDGDPVGQEAAHARQGFAGDGEPDLRPGRHPRHLPERPRRGRPSRCRLRGRPPRHPHHRRRPARGLHDPRPGLAGFHRHRRGLRHPDGPRMVTVRDWTGQRPWTDR
jgi:hypothetical protein